MDAGKFLGKADQEININIRGPMHLALHVLAHFRGKGRGTIVNVSSVLGYISFSTINPVYNASKAWMHLFTLNLRTQINNIRLGDGIKVIEIAPPAVETNLHRECSDPDDNKKSKNDDKVLSIQEFMEEVTQKLEGDEEMLTAGMGNGIVGKWYGAHGKMYANAEGFQVMACVRAGCTGLVGDIILSSWDGEEKSGG